jgi:ATP-dependent Clp protease ATP-binding subunit ClpA
MMFERFTRRAREVVVQARKQAERLGHEQADTEHLLLAMLLDGSSIAGRVLRDVGLDFDAVRGRVEDARRKAQVLGEADAAALREIGIDLDAVRAKVEEAFGPGVLRADEQEPRPPRWLALLRRWERSGPFAPRAKKVLELSLREALRLRHNYIGTEHILLGLIREGKGVGALILVDMGIDLEDLRRRVLAVLRAAA